MRIVVLGTSMLRRVLGSLNEPRGGLGTLQGCLRELQGSLGMFSGKTYMQTVKQLEHPERGIGDEIVRTTLIIFEFKTLRILLLENIYVLA